MICKYWFEEDFGKGLKEYCKITGRQTLCCGYTHRCECKDRRVEIETGKESER